MAYSRAEVPELENLLKYGKKKQEQEDQSSKIREVTRFQYASLMSSWQDWKPTVRSSN